MSMKGLFGGTAFEAQIHSHHSECKNVQKPVLTNVNMQRNDLPYFQMFAFLFWTAPIFADFCLFGIPPLSLGDTIDVICPFLSLDTHILSLRVHKLYYLPE